MTELIADRNIAIHGQMMTNDQQDETRRFLLTRRLGKSSDRAWAVEDLRDVLERLTKQADIFRELNNDLVDNDL